MSPENLQFFEHRDFKNRSLNSSTIDVRREIYTERFIHKNKIKQSNSKQIQKFFQTNYESEQRWKLQGKKWQSRQTGLQRAKIPDKSDKSDQNLVKII